MLCVLVLGRISLGEIMAFEPSGLLDAVIQAESNWRKDIVNPDSGATGLGQITSFALEDFNKRNKEKYTMEDMFDPQRNMRVSYWYLTERIPQMLSHYGIPVTLDNVLASYNWGVGNLKNKGLSEAPKETTSYIETIKSILNNG